MKTENLIQKLIDEGPQKPMPHPIKQTTYWLLGMMFYLLIFSGFAGLRADITEKFLSLHFVIELILIVTIGIFSALSAFCLARPDGQQLPGLKIVPFALIVMWLLLTFSSSGDLVNGQNLVHSISLRQFDCPLHIALFSLPPGIALFLFVRMGATTQFYWAGSMATLSVTSFGYLLMRLIEPNDNLAHLIIWHILPIMVICLFGMIIGKLILKWR
ncbi:MAG: DUF1109 domain-containing protein [Proteobacteria bacterium]|nr:MAG: DUF1109 domain-containing protein [Pseudomonadota bacterium]